MAQEMVSYNNKSPENFYFYETKCRRCNSFYDWLTLDKREFSYEHFKFVADQYIAVPKLHPCQVCGKQTIQDVVAYDVPE